MGEKIGAEVWLDRVPLKYEGLSYTEIWISEAQERMVLSVPADKWDELRSAVPLRRRRGDGHRPVRADRPAAAEVRRATGGRSDDGVPARRPPAGRPRRGLRAATTEERGARASGSDEGDVPTIVQRRSARRSSARSTLPARNGSSASTTTRCKAAASIKPLVGVGERRPERRRRAAARARVAARHRHLLRHEPALRRFRHLPDGRQRDRRGGAQLRGRRRRSARGSPSSTTSAGATPTGPKRSARWSAPPWPATTWPSRWARRSSAARTA